MSPIRRRYTQFHPQPASSVSETYGVYSLADQIPPRPGRSLTGSEIEAARQIARFLDTDSAGTHEALRAAVVSASHDYRILGYALLESYDVRLGGQGLDPRVAYVWRAMAAGQSELSNAS